MFKIYSDLFYYVTKNEYWTNALFLQAAISQLKYYFEKINSQKSI